MNLRYESQGSNTFLVYDIRAEDTIDTMSLGMLTNNHIDGLAQTFFTQMDDEKFIKFNVSAKVSASQLFEGLVNRKRLVGVFCGIISAMQAAEEYMLDPGSILLDLDYIFVDVTTYEAALICLPIENPNRPPVDLAAFCKNIIFNTQYDQTENCDHVAQILNYLNKNPILVLDDFRNLLDGIAKGKGGAQPVVPRPQPEAPRTVIQNPTPAPAAPETTQIQSNAPVQTQPAVSGQVQNLNRPPVAQKPQPQIPPRQVPPASPAVPPAAQPQNKTQEKPISLMYLLQHYNKENAAAYKAQQEAKKSQKAADPKKEKKAAAPVNMGYAIPGQQAAPSSCGYAIPGQPAAPVQQQAARPEPQVTTQQQPQVNLQPAPTIYHQPSAPINFGETTVLGGGNVGETTVLGVTAEPNRMDPHLIRVKNNERVSINKPSFRIGKERSYVDYFIGDNTAISRSHANIESIDGEYFVMDTNSTNHTYVNGGMIQSNQRVKLAHGTKIRLANEDFEFRLY